MFTESRILYSAASQIRRFIFGLPTMKELNMSMHPSNNVQLVGDQSFPCEPQPRRISCLVVYSSKMQITLLKAARDKRNESDSFLGVTSFYRIIGNNYNRD